MANISGYLANIKSASRGEDVRDSIINALNAINLDNPAVIKPLNVTANGTYAGQGGIVYNPVTVNVPEGTSNAIALKSIKITENGETEADDGEAFSSVEVDVPQYTNEILEEVTFTQNGDYDALLDGYDGYGLVHVNVQQGGTGSYTVKFFAADRTTVLQTVVGVPAGGGAAYTAGPNPTSSGMRFVGWTPNPLQIYADTNCYPRFENLIWDETQIQDDWITIAKNVRTNPDAYNIGQWKLLELNALPLELIANDPAFDSDYQKEEYANVTFRLYMTLVGKGVDPLEGENGYAPTTWVGRLYVFPFSSGVANSLNQAIPEHCRWDGSRIRTFLQGTFTKYQFPQTLLPYLRRVIKYTSVRDMTTGALESQSFPTIDWLWIPSLREMIGGCTDIESYSSSIEDRGPIYDYFSSDENGNTTIALSADKRKVKYMGNDAFTSQRLRTSPKDRYYGRFNTWYIINSGGSPATIYSGNGQYVLGFCL